MLMAEINLLRFLSCGNWALVLLLIYIRCFGMVVVVKTNQAST